MNQAKNKLLILVLFVNLFSSCYEHTEGCRDINALNFDVVADKDCEDNCCKYPNVYLDFKLFKDSITVDTNTILVNNFNDTFRIKYFRMYLSDFSLINTQNDTIELLNKIKYGIEKNDKIEYDNINFPVLKLKAKPQSYNLGNLKVLNKYSELIFYFGIKSTINHAIMDKLDISNPLSFKDNDMYINTDSGYYFLKMNLEMADSTIKNINISGDKYLSKINIKHNFDLSERKNHYISLHLDVSKWLLPVDFNKNNDEITNNLLDNLNKSMILD